MTFNNFNIGLTKTLFFMECRAEERDGKKNRMIPEVKGINVSIQYDKDRMTLILFHNS